MCRCARPPARIPRPLTPASVGRGLTLHGDSVNATDTTVTGRLRLVAPVLPEYGPDIAELALDVRYENDDHVRVRIYDPASSRWETPAVLQDDRVGGGGGDVRCAGVGEPARGPGSRDTAPWAVVAAALADTQARRGVRAGSLHLSRAAA